MRCHLYLGIFFIISSDTLSGVLPSARPIRLVTLKTWVSTGKAGISKASTNTTDAVFLPTPGRDMSSSMLLGTWPPYLSLKTLSILYIFFALFLYRPICLIFSSISSWESFKKLSKSGYSLYKFSVTLLTLLSVVWALSIVEINN